MTDYESKSPFSSPRQKYQSRKDILLNFGTLIAPLLQDGRIDYGEFAAMMRKGDGGFGRSRTMRSNLNFNLAEAFGIKDST